MKTALAVAAIAAALFIALRPSQAPSLQLALVDRLGNRQIAGTLPPTTFAPRISPNGRQVTYDASDGRGTTVWLYSLASRTSRMLTTGDAHYPMWSADGERVLFASDRQGTPAIYWQRADGQGTAERLTDAARAPESWSQANQMFSFITLLGSDYDVWAFSLNDRKAFSLFRIPASPQHSSAFSPDGRWVAYLSEESGSGEVWVQPFPPTGAKYRVTTGGGTRPLWSPDGKELFFDNNNGRMFSVAVTGIEPFATGAPVSLPITGFIQGPLRRQYDLTADGKHFLMLFP